MDTTEHTELGNALRFQGWDTLQSNPYIHIDKAGVLHLDLQGINDMGLPESVGLKLSSGAIVGMSGDYFGGKEVSFDLPTIAEFKANPRNYDSTGSCETLGKYLIQNPITEDEQQKLIRSYQRLANKTVHQSEIDTIYTINSANYIPFSSTLNFYMQQLMFALRVKNYSEILNRNLSHFTPWSVRAYTIGHHIALQYALIHYELKQYLTTPNYQSNHDEFNKIRILLEKTPDGMTADKIQDLAYRYQALSLGMEFFCFHYYTDHFAAGHISFVGDLRAVLPQHFGVLGGILVNNIHDELNRITVYTKRAYDPLPKKTQPPIEAAGDGDFDATNNYFNKQACLVGMTHSLDDLHQAFKGNKRPAQTEFGGLKAMPDIDEQYRQPKPLFLLGQDNKVYYRTDLKRIDMLSPSQLQAIYAAPLEQGYTPLNNTFEAFVLVFKLRVLSFIYKSHLEKPTSEQLVIFEEEESKLNPGRKPIPRQTQQPITLPVWQRSAEDSAMQGLINNGVLSHSRKQKASLVEEPKLTSSFTP